MAEDATSTVGRYKAKQSASGSWTIFDVPVFGQMAAGEKDDELEVDDAWLKAALKNARTLAGKGYLPPLHVRHHRRADGVSDIRVEPAGQFRLKRVGDHELEGQEIRTLFADLENVPPSIMKRIEQGLLAYRSAEVPISETPEVKSVALLPDEEPFFRYPNMTIGERIPCHGAPLDFTAHVERRASNVGGIASISTADRRLLLFRMEGKKTMADDDKGKKDDAQAMGEGGEVMTQILAVLKAIATKLGIGGGGGADGEAGAPVDSSQFADDDDDGKDDDDVVDAADDDDDEKGKGKGKDDQSRAKTNVIQLAKLTGRVNSLEKHAADRRKSDATSALEATARTELKGYALTEEDEKAIAQFAGYGKEAVDEYVATVKRSRTMDPGDLGDLGTNDGDDAGARKKGKRAKDPKEVLAFSSQGADALDTARKVNVTFETLRKKRGFVQSRKNFLAFVMAEKGFDVEAEEAETSAA